MLASTDDNIIIPRSRTPKYWVAYKENANTRWKCRYFFRQSNAKHYLHRLIYSGGHIQQIRDNVYRTLVTMETL